MSNTIIHMHEVISRFRENHLNYQVLELQNQVKVIISEYGGRILGPFYDEYAEGIYWIHPSFADNTLFKTLYEQRHWNLGGDRLWLAPELNYNVPDRNHFFDNYFISPHLDPGNYTLIHRGLEGSYLYQDLNMKVHNSTISTTKLRMENEVRRIPDPLQSSKHYERLIDGVIYAGYEQTTTLTEYESSSLPSQIWSLAQLNPGGDIYVPVISEFEYSDHYEPVENTHMTLHDRYVQFKVDGAKRYKVGMKPICHLGRAGYVNKLKDGGMYLIIKHFFNNPSSEYTSNVYHSPDQSGFSLDIYHDNGDFGGYAELECYGRPLGHQDKKQVSDSFITWLYIGDEQKIKEIANKLLGIKI